MTKVQVGKMNLAILDLGIVRWTLKGPDGKIVPPTKKWIYALDERSGDFILGEINAFNPRRSAEAQENFRAESGDRAEE